jgi:ubiquinone/menaquinone biosynthesis C-methylase UbiE
LHRRFSTNPYGWTHWIFDQTDVPPEARVLELGCGPGFLWKNNVKRVSPTWRITLSDLSFGMLCEARANAGNANLQISFAHRGAEALPFGDDTFDAVVANHMLYHVEDRDHAISEVRRVLRPRGTFYAATNGLAHLRELDRIIAGPREVRDGLSTAESFCAAITIGILRSSADLIALMDMGRATKTGYTI